MFLIHGIKRIKTGKSASRQLRRISNQIPSIIYGIKKPEIYISLNHDEIFNMQKHPDFYSSKITIKIQDINYLVSIKNIQYHCFKSRLLHIDFLHL
ncbi:50S ribosomal protein L25 [Buchnera aphidicola]|uniref:50S ribosomal protein L25 n=1 Tax=Buchnera aphidicola TaxID=9 RepID=UPI00346446DC